MRVKYKLVQWDTTRGIVQQIMSRMTIVDNQDKPIKQPENLTHSKAPASHDLPAGKGLIRTILKAVAIGMTLVVIPWALAAGAIYVIWSHCR